MRYRRWKSRPHAAIAAVPLLLLACGSTPSGPELITVDFEASGVVLRQGEPVAAAHVVLVRRERMGPDGCVEYVTLAAAMTNRVGDYAIDYICVCKPGQPMPQHSLLVEMPATVAWNARAGDNMLQGSAILGDPGE
ncbi:MAG: hypothetical protein P8125_05310 [Gemmatimonadota bacterium]|jgi:hypothetical protein